VGGGGAAAASLRRALGETAVILAGCVGELMLRDVEALLELYCARVRHEKRINKVRGKNEH
jgi:hypothetical protein